MLWGSKEKPCFPTALSLGQKTTPVETLEGY